MSILSSRTGLRTISLRATSWTTRSCFSACTRGVPLTELADYLTILPDRITIFQGSIEEICETNEEIIEEIRSTVVHEVAHHFGIDDERLYELGV